MINRLTRFLKFYSMNDEEFLYDRKSVILKVKKRLLTLADWSESFGKQTGNNEILEDAKMYISHANWVLELLL